MKVRDVKHIGNVRGGWGEAVMGRGRVRVLTLNYSMKEPGGIIDQCCSELSDAS